MGFLAVWHLFTIVYSWVIFGSFSIRQILPRFCQYMQIQAPGAKCPIRLGLYGMSYRVDVGKMTVLMSSRDLPRHRIGSFLQNKTCTYWKPSGDDRLPGAIWRGATVSRKASKKTSFHFRFQILRMIFLKEMGPAIDKFRRFNYSDEEELPRLLHTLWNSGYLSWWPVRWGSYLL